MASLFISYSRKDVEAARKLTEAFKGQELDYWIDWEGIPPTVDWWQEIEQGIEEADIFLFFLSPDSAQSKVCKQEIEHAVKNGKRLIPIVVRDITSDEAPSEINHLNWMFFRSTDEFNPAFAKLMTAIKTDYGWVQVHRQLQVKALEWERSNHENSFLLRGKELQDAELQLATNTSKEPHPTDLQREYVFKSRQASDKQRRITFGIAIAGVIALAALAVYGFIQAGRATTNAKIAQNQAETAQANAEEAQQQAKIARAGELASLSIAREEKNYSEALLLGIEAYQRMDALRKTEPAINDSRTKDALITLLQYQPGIKYILSGHSGWVQATAFNSGGSILATASADKTIGLWSISSAEGPQKIKTLDGYVGGVSSVAFSPDGKILASGSFWDTDVILWQGNFSSKRKLTGHQAGVTSVVFSPSGKLLASGSNDNSVILWDVSDLNTPGTEISRLYQSSAVNEIALSPNGLLLASANGDGTVILWDISNPSAPVRLSSSIQHEYHANATVFHPAESVLATGGGDSNIVLWDISNPSTPRELNVMNDHLYTVESLSFSPDGNYLASGSWDNTMILWDVSQVLDAPKKLETFTTQNFDVTTVAFSPDGKTLVSGSGDTTAILWDISRLVTPLQINTQIRERNSLTDIAVSPDKTVVAAASWQTIVLHKIISGTISQDEEVLSGHSGWVNALAFDKSGKSLASAGDDGKIVLWDMNNRSKLATLEGHTESVSSVSFSSDDSLLASGSNDDDVILWDISNPHQPKRIFILRGHTADVRSVLFSPNEKLLASCAWDFKIILWDVSNPSKPKQVSTMDIESDVRSLAFSPDGTLLATGIWEATTTLWDISNPAIAKKIDVLTGHSEPVEDLKFSPDGNALASSGSGDQTIILWDISNHSDPVQISTLKGHTEPISAISFDPNGKSLFSASWDGTIIQWDIDPQSWLGKACQIVGRNFTRKEWAQYFPDEDYRKTCEQWPLEPETITTPSPTP